MALLNRQISKQFIKNRAGEGIITSDDVTSASASFASGIELSDPNIIGSLGPVLYHMDLIQEDIGEIRRYMTSSFSVPSRVGSAASSGDIGAGAEIFELHNSAAIVQGAVYHLRSSDWAYANATSAGIVSYGFLGVSRGSDITDGFVIKGIVYVGTDPGGNIGDVVYLSTSSGRLTTTAPSTSGNVVRVMGHKIGTNLVYFNPSTNWVELS